MWGTETDHVTIEELHIISTYLKDVKVYTRNIARILKDKNSFVVSLDDGGTGFMCSFKILDGKVAEFKLSFSYMS